MTAPEPIGLALIGCGSVAVNMHLNGWTRFPHKARLLAVFDVEAARAERMAGMVREAYAARAYEYDHRALRIAVSTWLADEEARLRQLADAARRATIRPEVSTDLDRLLADPRIEAVIVATPHHLHAPLSVQGLQAGKHVFSEGPMAINLEEADAVLAAWRASGAVYTAQYYSRYFRGSRQALRLARSGKLGPLLMSRGDALWYRTQEYYGSNPWRGTRRAGDRVYMHHGRYAMDLLLWLMDDAIEEVYAYAATKTHQIEVEDNAAVQVRFASGAFAQLLLSTSAHPAGPLRTDIERFELLGERASVAGVLDYDSEDTAITLNSRDARYAEELARWIADEPPMPAGGATTHYQAFVDAIQGGPPMLTEPTSTRAQVELARAIGRSLTERRPVTLPLRPSDPFYGPVDGYDR